MAAHLDAIGNVCGRYEGDRPGLPCLMLGSHYDTVRDAGKWDGPLGLHHRDFLRRRSEPARAAVAVRDRGDRLCRRGGRALCLHAARQPRGRGHLRSKACSMRATVPASRCAMRWCTFGLDPDHIGAAARTRRELLAYVELHIEQGPVLEQKNFPVGVVTAIAGATRLAAKLTGMAGHAGTVPMALRRDALAGAAECIGAIEEFCRTDAGRSRRHRRLYRRHARRHQRDPGAGRRSRSTSARRPIRTASARSPTSCGGSRRSPAAASLALQLDVTHENRTVPCAPWLKAQVAEAVAAEGFGVFELPSGAGHDGMAMIDIADVAHDVRALPRRRQPSSGRACRDCRCGRRRSVLLRLVENFRAEGGIINLSSRPAFLEHDSALWLG